MKTCVFIIMIFRQVEVECLKIGVPFFYFSQRHPLGRVWPQGPWLRLENGAELGSNCGSAMDS